MNTPKLPRDTPRCLSTPPRFLRRSPKTPPIVHRHAFIVGRKYHDFPTLSATTALTPSHRHSRTIEKLEEAIETRCNKVETFESILHATCMRLACISRYFHMCSRCLARNLHAFCIHTEVLDCLFYKSRFAASFVVFAILFHDTILRHCFMEGFSYDNLSRSFVS